MGGTDVEFVADGGATISGLMCREIKARSGSEAVTRRSGCVLNAAHYGNK